jgi:hypothetical protein
MRTIAAGGAASPVALLAGASLFIVYSGSMLVFAGVYQCAVRAGLFAQWCAESILR